MVWCNALSILDFQNEDGIAQTMSKSYKFWNVGLGKCLSMKTMFVVLSDIYQACY